MSSNLARFFSCALFSCAVCFASEASAVTAQVDAVEVTVVIESDGNATVTDRVSWVVTQGPMSKMNFMNPAISPTFGTMFVDLESAAERIPLTLETVSDTHWKFAANPKVPEGKSYWTFQYKGNMVDDGLIGITAAEDTNEELYYIHWAPVQWDDPLQYRDVKIILPIPLPSNTVSDELFKQIAGYSRTDGMGSGNANSAWILTCKTLNERNKIDYEATDVGGGRYLLTMHIHQADVSSMESQKILFYVRPKYIKFDETVISKFETRSFSSVRDEYSDELSPFWGEMDASGGSIATGVFLIIAAAGTAGWASSRSRRRKKQLSEAKTRTEEALNDFWEAPQLQVGSFQQKGKVIKDLHPIEVGLLLGLEVSQIIGMIAQAMADQNKLVIQSLEPLRAVAGVTDDLEEIEKQFIEIFELTGDINTQKLQSFLENTISKLQEKAWDCDLDATRKYYLEKLYENPEETDPEKLRFIKIEESIHNDARKASDALSRSSNIIYRDDDFYRRREYWIYYNGYYTHQYHYNHGLPADFNHSYVDFMRQASCFHGCFEQPDLKEVCHSACHDACHSACHDACHSACHDACHDACHSACVSGGAE